MLNLYIHPESGCAFLDANKLDYPCVEFICEVADDAAPKTQAQFEDLARAQGIGNAEEFSFNIANTVESVCTVQLTEADLPEQELAPIEAPKAKRGAPKKGEVLPQTILKLTIENVKRLSAVSITPDGATVVIGGKNGAGKSSVLDAIMMAIGGKSAFTEKPIREGEKRGTIEVETEDFIISRSITPSGGTITVTARDGSKYSSPQQLLDSLTGKMTFDPLEFSRMKPKDQLETLKQLVNLDLSEEETQRTSLYNERTLRGRDLSEAKAMLAQAVHHTGVSEKEISMGDLATQLQAVQTHNNKRRELSIKIGQYEQLEVTNQKLIADLEEKLANAKQQLVAATGSKAAFTAAYEAMPLKDEAPIVTSMTNIEATNRKVRENIAHAAAEKKVQYCNAAYDELTVAIEHLDAQKAKKIADTKFPVAGLSFGDTGVLVNGLPFSEASTAEQIRISVAMGLSLNPTLKVILIRDGGLLDSTSLGLITQMATLAGAQVWIEKVSETGEGCQVVIEDGHVK